MQQTECNYWVERATNAGLSQFEITTLLMRSSEALPDQVRRREEMRRQASRGERENKVSVEGNTLELSVAFVVDHSECSLTERRIELKNGNYLEVYANPKIGMIREFDLNVLLACYKVGQENDYQEYYVSDYNIATELDVTDNGRIYAEIDKSFDRLGACYIKTNNWWNPKTKERVSIAAFNFLQRYEYNEKTGIRKIRFSDWVEESIKENYLKQIDYKKAINLKGAAKIIHLNLAKLIGNKKYFEISEELVLRWLGKWDKYNAMTGKRRNENIKRFINPKVKEAVEALNRYNVKKNGQIWQISK